MEDIRVKYDLVQTIAPFLDLHMMLPLIRHLQGQEGMYNEGDLLMVFLDFVKATRMVDYSINIINNLPPELSCMVSYISGYFWDC